MEAKADKNKKSKGTENTEEMSKSADISKAAELERASEKERELLREREIKALREFSTQLPISRQQVQGGTVCCCSNSNIPATYSLLPALHYITL